MHRDLGALGPNHFRNPEDLLEHRYRRATEGKSSQCHASLVCSGVVDPVRKTGRIVYHNRTRPEVTLFKRTDDTSTPNVCLNSYSSSLPDSYVNASQNTCQLDTGEWLISRHCISCVKGFQTHGMLTVLIRICGNASLVQGQISYVHKGPLSDSLSFRPVFNEACFVLLQA